MELEAISGLKDPVKFNTYGLLTTRGKITYNFTFFAIQEILCGLYVSTLPQQEKYH